MSTIFQKIIDKELPAFIVAEDLYSIAFLDIHPLVEGHLIVISKVDDSDYIFDMNIDNYNRLFSFSRSVAQALKIAMPCQRIGSMIAGFEIAHAHIHLLPINSSSTLNFNSPPLEISKTRMGNICDTIAEQYRIITNI